MLFCLVQKHSERCFKRNVLKEPEFDGHSCNNNQKGITNESIAFLYRIPTGQPSPRYVSYCHGQSISPVDLVIYNKNNNRCRSVNKSNRYLGCICFDQRKFVHIWEYQEHDNSDTCVQKPSINSNKKENYTRSKQCFSSGNFGGVGK